MSTIQRIGLLAGPLLALFLSFIAPLEAANPLVSYTAGIAVWMAVWWVTEVVPLAVTALLPVILFPVLGIMDGKAVAPIYFNNVIFLFIGGFLVALAMQRWNLHKRIALRILLWFGVRPQGILLGFMVATAFLSMWISNTATTMMMVPIALSIILRLEDILGVAKVKRYSIGVFLGVAYSASIGGIATLVGTPPNLALVKIFNIMFPAAPEISFAEWFLFAFPITVIFLTVVWLILVFLFCPKRDRFKLDVGIFEKQYKKLGPMSYEEKIVLVDFVLLALLWLTRARIQVGDFFLPGWSQLFANPGYFNDGTVAIMMATILFLIPAAGSSSMRILDWDIAAKLPWDIVLLFGGGFALASGFKESGLDRWLGQHFAGIGELSPLLIVVAICLFVTFLTELTSNTATAQMFLPILGSLAVTIKVNPLLLMIPATLSCSFAFMLPVATPPNAIIFGTGRLKIKNMVKVGIWLNLFGVIIVTIAVLWLGQVVLNTDLFRLPEWAVAQ